MKKYGKIEDMLDYFRMWVLVRYLVKKGHSYAVEARLINKTLDTDIIYCPPLETFLEERVEKCWFGIGKSFSVKYRKNRIEKYGELMREAHGLNYVEIATVTNHVTNKKTIVIHHLSAGYIFSAPTTGLEGFLQKFPKVNIAIYIVFGWLISQSPTFKPLTDSVINYFFR